MYGENIVLGIDLGGTDIKSAVIDSAGKIISSNTNPTPRTNTQELIKAIVEIISLSNKQYKCKLKIGIGVPAVFDNLTKEVIMAPNLVSKSFPLRKGIEEAIGYEIVMDNDANMAALGEWWVGAGKSSKNLIMLTLGTGIGAGIIIDGDIYKGSRGWAGEIGHTIVIPNGKECTCGKKGCLEAYASAAAISKIFNSKAKLSLNTKDIFKLAQEGEGFAQEVINEAQEALALAIYNYILIFDPEVVVLGGGMAKAGEMLLQPLIHKINNLLNVYPGKNHTVLQIAELGNQAGVLGAARIALGIN